MFGDCLINIMGSLQEAEAAGENQITLPAYVNLAIPPIKTFQTCR